MIAKQSEKAHKLHGADSTADREFEIGIRASSRGEIRYSPSRLPPNEDNSTLCEYIALALALATQIREAN